jgi:hypothetical protein
MATIKKLTGKGEITVNSQDIPAEVNYFDIPEVLALADHEGPVRGLRGKLSIEGDTNFLSGLAHQMTGAECILYLEDGRHVKFDPNFDFSFGDTRLDIHAELISSIES